MAIRIIKGHIISAPSLGVLEITENGYLIANDGCILGVYPVLPGEYIGLPVEDYGDCLVLQAFADMHLHGPQYPMLGMGMDLELLEWLNTYTFPTESRFSDPEYARQVYRRLAQELVSEGTTRVCMFSSLHLPATRILMEELENAGVTGFVGKVNMDRNNIPALDETTEDSMKNTLAWLDGLDAKGKIKPILTPRFTPSCTDELMTFLGKLAQERKLPVQSHLSENRSEVDWVRSLHPDCAQYWETYAKFGLWGKNTLMAHCVWCDQRERNALRTSGTIVVHCPDSNVNLNSGVSPVRTMLNEGITVVLGSDIAGGDRLSGFDVVASAIRSSKIRNIQDESRPKPLSVSEAWYLGVSAPAEFFGEKPGFAPGNQLNAVVLADDRLENTANLTLQERFERAVYRRQSGAIQAVYSADRKILG